MNRIKNIGSIILGVGTLCLTNACASRTGDIQIQYYPQPVGAYEKALPDELPKNTSAPPKYILVFYDGTANTPESQTNIWKIFESVRSLGRSDIQAIYIPGVGTDHKYVGNLPGEGLGTGQERRIELGYRFISHHYSAGAKIGIFGFSRGAMQARCLAGHLCYAGVPTIINSKGKVKNIDYNDIIDKVKKSGDENTEIKRQRLSWVPGNQPFAKDQLTKKFKCDFSPVEISFLGVWDTVPGSAFKTYEDFKERNDGKDRYKILTYGPIRFVAHAVSLDEKRDRFFPILVAAPDVPTTIRHERWFPGAHSDVGGGYPDDDGLPGISYNWMIGLLKQQWPDFTELKEQPANHKGRAHYSIGDWEGAGPLNLMTYKDRKPPSNNYTQETDPSADRRAGAAPVPIMVRGKEQQLVYPIGKIP